MNITIREILILIFGIFIGYILTSNYFRNKSNAYISKVRDFYKDLLNKFESLSFKKRINDYVYLDYDKYEVILNLKNNTINIFENSECVYVSSNLEKELVNDIYHRIMTKWSSEIYNVVNINGNTYSLGFIESETKKATESLFSFLNIEEGKFSEEIEDLSIDDILDKISKEGMSSLTQKEIDFLDKNSK